MVRKPSLMQEEYLELIYRLEEKEGVAKTGMIAQKLKVALGTVTNTIANLEKKGFLVHKPYIGIQLTEKGREIALEILRRHRLSERLLADVLEIPWSATHDIACKFEHIINENVTEAMEKSLKYPKTCPHGNPIPTKCKGVVEEKSEPLTTFNPEESGTIIKIQEETSEVLEYLARLGLVPGVSIEVVERTSFDGPMTVRVGGANHMLSSSVASIIWVKRS
ncbi:MAG: metal-dependent transcriptional regulator [Nitrososphaerales archaeon]